jgi:predicted RNA-binding Zn ribbon-like protein
MQASYRVRIVAVHPVEIVLPEEPPSVRLMNTVWLDGDGAFDCLRDGDDLRILLAALGRPAPARPSAAQVGAARELREALRTLGAAVTGSADPPAAADRRRAAATIDAALAAAPLRESLRPAPQGWTLQRSVEESFAGSLGLLARDGAELIAARGGTPLRTCPAPSCGLYFVATHARRRWCSAHCGDRVRAARYYRRHHRPAAERADRT